MRSLGIVVLALLGAVALAVSSTMTTVVQLLATTALIMSGTFVPDPPPDYVDGAVNKYITPALGAPDHVVAVRTPEEFWPIFGTLTFDQSVADGVADLHPHVVASGTGRDPQNNPNTFVIFGYSSSARIATIEKRNLIENYDAETSPRGAIVMIGNPNRGNGGILKRFEPFFIPILGVTFDGATPTNSPVDPGDPDDPSDDTFVYPTEDYVRQYAGWEDFPVAPLNFLATANAIAGIVLLHGDYFSDSVGDPLYQGTLGDTNYYIIPTPHLPLLMVLDQIGIPSPIVTAMDAPMRVLVERAYRRDINPGTPTRARLISLTNPINDVVNFVVAIPTGIDDAIAEANNDPTFRPLGTTAVTSPFGVGGPDLPEPPPGVTPSLAAAPESQAEAQAKVAEPAPEVKQVDATAEVTQSNDDAVGNTTADAEDAQSNDDGVGNTTADAEDAQSNDDAVANATADAEDAQSNDDAVANATADAEDDAQTAESEADTPKAPSAPSATKPRPLRQIVRGPIGFDRQKPSAVRASGDRPLKKVLNALTGERPKPAADASEPDTEPSAAADGAADGGAGDNAA